MMIIFFTQYASPSEFPMNVVAMPNSERTRIDASDASPAEASADAIGMPAIRFQFSSSPNRCSDADEKTPCCKCPQNKTQPTKRPNNAIIPAPSECRAPAAAALELPKRSPAFDVATDDDAATVLAAANCSSPAVMVTGR